MRTRVLSSAAVVLVTAALAVVLYVVNRPDLVRPEGIRGELPDWWDVLAPAAWTLTGALLLWLRPRNRVGLLILVIGTCQAVSQASAAYGLYGIGIADPHWPAADWVALVGTPLWVPGFFPLLSLLLAIYPDGRLPDAQWRWPVRATAVGIALLTVAMVDGYNDVAPGPAPATLPDQPALAATFLVVTAVCLIGGTLSIWALSIRRLIRARPPERQQLAWLYVCVVPLMIAGAVGPERNLIVGLALALPAAIAVGVLRYGMLGIELVLRRGLVFVLLTGVVMGAYLAIAALAGASLGDSPLPVVLTAALVAVGLTPLRDRLQHAVDRLVYGERRDPFRAVLRMGDTVATEQSQDLLETVLGTVTAAVRTGGAAVEGPDGLPIASAGSIGTGERLPLRVGGSDVGTLVVSRRTPGETFSDGDLRLLHALAQQVAVVVRAQDLAESLELERDRVLAATTSERDRLRRDLHDGLGPSLSGVGLGLQAVESALAEGDARTATEVLAVLRRETGTAVSEVRRILDDLRPTALDGARLPEALRTYAATVSTHVPVDVTVDAPVLEIGPDLEAAVYRIAQEAITNAARHSGAGYVGVHVSASGGRLRLEVRDDGSGMGTTRGSGVGLESMRHRAESVSGTLVVDSGPAGTRIVADLPWAGTP